MSEKDLASLEGAPARKKPGPRAGDPRTVEAGRRGGQRVAAERGPEYYREIGRKGGQKTRQNQGPDFFASIGKKGGESVKEEHGTAFFSRIGKKGGSAERKRRNGEATEIA